MKTIKRATVIALTMAILATSVVFAAACTTKDFESIEITTAPTKTEYFEGQTFDASGMTVTAKYPDGKTEPVTDYTVTPAGALAATDTEVTVTYKGLTAKQPVTVTAKAAESLAITHVPTTVEYAAGDTFDASGMKVTVTYNDGTCAEVADYATYPASRKLNVKDDEIVVTYDGITAAQPITVTADASLPADAPQMYALEGQADIAGTIITVTVVLYGNHTVLAKLNTGMGAMVDGAIARYLSFPGTWERTESAFTVKMNSFTFDPKTMAGLAGLVPEDMKEMFATLTAMDPIDIKGGLSAATLSDGKLTFDAHLSAFGITLDVGCKGTGAPDSLEIKAGDPLEAEFADLCAIKMTKPSSKLITSRTACSNKAFVSNSDKTGSVWQARIDSAAAAKGAQITVQCAASLENLDVNDYIALTVNGKEAALTGKLTSTVSFAALTATADLQAGENTIAIVWKADQVVNIDYLAFSADVTLLNPTLGVQ